MLHFIQKATIWFAVANQMIGFYMKLNIKLKRVKVDYDVIETTAFSSKVTVMTLSRDQVSIFWYHYKIVRHFGRMVIVTK